jgi:hypothetical protein
MRLTLPNTRRTGKGAWVALITGTDPSLRLRRSFLRGDIGRAEITFDQDDSVKHAVSRCPAQIETNVTSPGSIGASSKS